MKEKKLNKRLVLSKTTISNLNDEEMNKAQGGATAVCPCSISCTPASRISDCSIC